MVVKSLFSIYNATVTFNGSFVGSFNEDGTFNGTFKGEIQGTFQKELPIPLITTHATTVQPTTKAQVLSNVQDPQVSTAPAHLTSQSPSQSNQQARPILSPRSNSQSSVRGSPSDLRKNQPSLPPKSPQSTSLLFIGNPGSGKSTLFNCLAGRAQFKAGLSFGRGLTQHRQSFRAGDGTRFVDTPGLADEAIRQQAAAEIGQALKCGGRTKIFFILTLESGRVRPDDKTTMKLVLDAIPGIGSNYSIIVNKISRDIVAQFDKDKHSWKTLVETLNDGLAGTNNISFCPNYPELNDKANAVISLEQELVNFINNAKAIVITPSDVKPIRFEKYDEIQLQLAAEMEKLKAENNNLRSKLHRKKFF